MKIHFGSQTDVNAITELAMDEFFQGLTCQRSTKLDWLVVFRSIMDKARKSNILEKNIAEHLKLPSEASSMDESAVKPFTVDEIQRLLLHSKGTELHNYLGVAFHLGTRPEETIALQIKDIDLINGIVRIERAITKGECKTPKTKGSIRSIPLPDQAKVFFIDLINDATSKGSSYLFSDDNGSALSDIEDLRGKKYRNGAWYQLLVRAKVPDRKLMQTRHTFAVQAIRSKAYTFQEIASILGHSSLDMIIHHYGKHLGDSHLKIARSVNIFEGLGDLMGDFEKDSVLKEVA
jgi:integrase